MHPSIFIGRPTITFDKIDSTNDYASKLISNSNPIEGTVIWAQYQTKGRGQIGSNWQADAGLNLLMSVILKPIFILANQQFTLNILASLAIKSALESYGVPVNIKWPNDIYVGKNKICGILIQNIIQGKSIKYAIIGIGLNVNQEKFDSSLPNPTSMKLCANDFFALDNVKSIVCKHFQDYYNKLKDEGYEELKQEYLQALYLKNVESDFQIDNAIISGKIIGIDSIGKLLLEVSGEIRAFNFREIKYL